jgi:hypothetical protein
LHYVGATLLYFDYAGFTPSPHDPTTPASRGSTPRTPRQPYATHQSTPPVTSGTTTPKPGHNNNNNDGVLGWSPSTPSKRGKPAPTGVGFPALASLRGRGSGHLSALARDLPQSPSFAKYSPAGNGGRQRKIVDMGAPVFVKAGTLFQDDQHQPDMPVDQGQYSPRLRDSLWKVKDF